MTGVRVRINVSISHHDRCLLSWMSLYSEEGHEMAGVRVRINVSTFSHHDRCLLSWMSCTARRAMRCSGRRKLVGSSMRRMWKRVLIVGVNLTSLLSRSTPWWSSGNT